MQTRIHTCTVARLTLSSDGKTVIKELQRTSVSLLLIFLLQRIRHLQQGIQSAALADNQVTKVRRQCRDEMQRIEALGEHLVKSQQGRRVIPLQERIHQGKTIFIVQHIKIAQDILILHLCAAERDSLVEDGQRVTHRTVSLMRDHVQRLVVDGDVLTFCHHPEVLHDVLHRDPVEVVGLATRKDGRKDLMLLCSRKNEYRVCRRFLQSLEERVESRLREHVHLIDDIHAVSSHLRRYAHLLHQRLDVLHTVVRSGVKLVDAVRTALCKRKAGLALSARLHVRRRVGAVDHLCEDPGSGGLAHSARSAEKICVRELAAKNRILQRLSDVILTYKCPEGVRSVLSC